MKKGEIEKLHLCEETIRELKKIMQSESLRDLTYGLMRCNKDCAGKMRTLIYNFVKTQILLYEQVIEEL